MGKLKRPSMAIFLKVKADFRLVGVYSDELSIAYNPQTETSQDVTEVAATTDVTGYQLTVPVTTKVVDKQGAKGYEVSEYIQDLRRSLATASDAETEALIVDLYKKVDQPAGSVYADKYKGVIQIDTYGGAAAETLGTEYTININGEPTPGSVKITSVGNGDKTAVFTPKGSPGA